MSNSALRVEVAIRAALIAKATLEMINMEPVFARLQLVEVAKLMRDLDKKLSESVGKLATDH